VYVTTTICAPTHLNVSVINPMSEKIRLQGALNVSVLMFVDPGTVFTPTEQYSLYTFATASASKWCFLSSSWVITLMHCFFKGG